MKIELSKAQKIILLKAVQKGYVTKELKSVCKSIFTGCENEFSNLLEIHVVNNKEDLEFYKDYTQFVENKENKSK